ncbi:hypothetical protein ACQP1K_02255 [Sphaerimonospora sp. CA-214678]|uniref:hypothetical protein n=1 Tax=Sphaerimonospora sp. CA-214678 TaxID=3240029 RepID=UPI003D91CE1D
MLIWKRVRTGCRSWVWLVVAVSAALVPWVLLATTSGGSWPLLPLMLIAIALVGASARDFLALDVFVIGLLPFQIGLAAVTRSRALVGVTCGICGVLALFHLVLFLGKLPITPVPAGTPADMLAGSQPDFYLGTRPDGGAWALAPLAYAVSAIALLISVRCEGRGVTQDN